MNPTTNRHTPQIAAHPVLQQIPEEITLPVLGLKLKPREALAPLIAPSPRGSVAMVFGGLVGLAVTVPFSTPVEPGTDIPPANQLLLLSIATLGYGCWRLAGHVEQFRAIYRTEAAVEAGRARGAAAQQAQLKRDYVELVRFEGRHPGSTLEIRQWMSQAHCSTWANEDGSLSIHIPRGNLDAVRNLDFQGPTTRVAIGQGIEIQVPTAILGNARR